MLVKRRDGTTIGEIDFSKAARAVLSGADLSGAVLRDADLSGADLRGADLSGADLRGAVLRGADLSGAVMSGAVLRGAVLRGADLSGAKGLIPQHEWLETNCQFGDDGLICYKALGLTSYIPPIRWKIKSGSLLTEVVNYDRTNDCACGVNVAATEGWCRENYPRVSVWQCLIPWKKLASVCVPYGTDGKFRAEYVVLLEKIA